MWNTAFKNTVQQGVNNVKIDLPFALYGFGCIRYTEMAEWLQQNVLSSASVSQRHKIFIDKSDLRVNGRGVQSFL
jgi:hypothetical protein